MRRATLAAFMAAGCLAALISLPQTAGAGHREKSEAGVPPSGRIEFTSSTLPLIVIDTEGRAIHDKSRIDARMKVIGETGHERNDLKTSPPTYTGHIGIEIRGQSSQDCPKKQYAFETRIGPNGSSREVPLLGMPAAAEWILQGPCFDRSLLRNLLAYQLSNKMGRYAVRARLVEAFIRERGTENPADHYRGVYVLMERIARGPERVNVAAASDRDPSGGYILKIDKGEGPHVITAHGTKILFVDPEKPSPAQKRYVRDYFDEFESALEEGGSDPEKGYPHSIDVDSFIDYFLLNELMKNVDAFRISTYMHKERGGKLEMGPVWDFDRSSGNIDSMGGNRPDGWYFTEKISGFTVPFWWRRLVQEEAFRKRLSQRWKTLRQDTLSDASITGIIDADLSRLKDAAERNFAVWPFLGSTQPPFNRDPKPSADYAGEIRELKDFLKARAAWMDDHVDTLGAAGASPANRAQFHP
ncbi:MAG TPA: CotH kinase family protein [Candidatus Polarisedimenticolia bacterium]|nr:CotH kinase family protein [Candidatus Polarisedimenticolia bacterium]